MSYFIFLLGRVDLGGKPVCWVRIWPFTGELVLPAVVLAAVVLEPVVLAGVAVLLVNPERAAPFTPGLAGLESILLPGKVKSLGLFTSLVLTLVGERGLAAETGKLALDEFLRRAL